MTTSAVLKGVQLLRHHIGGLANTSEHTDVFDQWSDDLTVSGRFHYISEYVIQRAPPGTVGRQDVPHAGTGLELGHGASGYRRGPPGSGTVSSAGHSSSSAARIQPVGVIDRVDALDRLQHRVQLIQVEQLELELHLGDTVGARHRLRRHDVDLVF